MEVGASRPTIEEVRFAGDSPLEEGGFELPVPLLRKGLPGVADARCLTDRLGDVIKRRSSRETAGALPTAAPLLRDREFEGAVRSVVGIEGGVVSGC
jgi:hypothetical protein